MVLISAMTDMHGEEQFLLLNTWEGKQFVVADIPYLHGCQAIPYFVHTRQTRIPANIATSTGFPWVEADSGEMPDHGAVES